MARERDRGRLHAAPLGGWPQHQLESARGRTRQRRGRLHGRRRRWRRSGRGSDGDSGLERRPPWPPLFRLCGLRLLQRLLAARSSLALAVACDQRRTASSARRLGPGGRPRPRLTTTPCRQWRARACVNFNPGGKRQTHVGTELAHAAAARARARARAVIIHKRVLFYWLGSSAEGNGSAVIFTK